MHFAEVELRRAFDEDEFFPVFQPIVELRTGQLIGFEALARWKHERLGLVPPDEFIPIVEKAGFIDRLTQTILEKAFASTALVESSLTLSVNISPLQLLALPVSTLIAGVAHQGGFALDRLTIEITESALVDDLERAKSVADELKALHCRLALDDFGTGYSSLKHLHALPFDELKVDRGFVSSTTQKRESRKIVAAVVGLGQSLGLVTVAEGVETQEQADMLLRMGCELGQGWLYGKPVPASELARLISPENGSEYSVTESLSKDGREAAVFAFLHSSQMGYPFPRVYLRGLDPKTNYRVTAIAGVLAKDSPTVASGSYWMSHGVDVDLRGDFQAAAFQFDIDTNPGH